MELDGIRHKESKQKGLGVPYQLDLGQTSDENGLSRCQTECDRLDTAAKNP